MVSTQQRNGPHPKIASHKGFYYLQPQAPHRKIQPFVEGKEAAVKVVRTYDEGYLFHLFCCANGQMGELFRLIEVMLVEDQRRIPKQSTLYKIAKDNDWRVRFEEIRKKMRENFEAQNGLPYTKIDQLASYVLQGTLMKFISALREEDYKNFSVKDLKSLWHMSRTERGLAPSVPFKDQNQGGYGEQIRRIHDLQKHRDSGAGPEFYERLEGLNPDELKLVEYVLMGQRSNKGASDDIPSIIGRK